MTISKMGTQMKRSPFQPGRWDAIIHPNKKTPDWIPKVPKMPKMPKMLERINPIPLLAG